MVIFHHNLAAKVAIIVSFLATRANVPENSTPCCRKGENNLLAALEFFVDPSKLSLVL